MTSDGDLVNDRVPPDPDGRPPRSRHWDGPPVGDESEGDDGPTDAEADDAPTTVIPGPDQTSDPTRDPNSDQIDTDPGPDDLDVAAPPPPDGPIVAEDGDDGDGDDGDGDAPKPRSAVRSLVEWAVVILGALVVATVIKTFLFQAFWIPSDSMQPTLQVKDRVLVNKLSYDLHDVHRGDVIVFERPPGETSAIKDLIKRVVAVEGDTLTLENGKVLVNGEAIDESYVAEGAQSVNICSFTGTVKVPEDHVFVMGDNRENSKDSRCFGPIDEDLIVGRAFVRVWPLNALGGL